MKNKDKPTPDFIQIPYQLIGDKTLAPIDRLVYGAVYFYSKMRGERCYASNTEIARLLLSTPNTVGNSLKKLEDRRYIIRGFTDPGTKVNRTEIIPTVAMGRMVRPRTPSGDGVSIDKTSPSPDGPGQLNDGVYSTKRWTKEKGSKTEILEEDVAQINDNIEDTPSKHTPSPDGQIEIERENIIENNKKDYWTHPSDGVQNIPTPSGEFTSMVKAMAKYDSVDKVPEQDVSDGIALFLSVFPDQFVTKNPFAVMANRNAVKKILMRLTLAELKEVVDKYASKKGDPYRPEAATIATFCNFKMDRIEAFVRKSAGGLWAHRSISTPAQSKVRDDQYQKIIDAGREKTRKAKEEWLRDHPEENLE